MEPILVARASLIIHARSKNLVTSSTLRAKRTTSFICSSR
jgi:hypothetical protein